MVKCEICGYEANKLLGNHLRSVHKISSCEYLKMFPGSEVSSSEWKEMMSERNKSDKMRKSLSERNKSDRMREATRSRNLDPEFQKKCKDGLNRPDVKKKMSIITSERNREMWKNDKYREHMRKRISDSQKRIMNDPSRKLKQSIAMKKFFDENPDFVEKFIDSPRKCKYGKRGTYYSSVYNKSFNYKSYGELEFILICENIIKADSVEYEKVHITLETGSTYTPDFLVEKNGCKYLVEIKFDDKDYSEYEYKINSGIRYCEENNLKFCYIRRFPDLKNFDTDSTLDNYVLCSSKIGLIAGNSSRMDNQQPSHVNSD